MKHLPEIKVGAHTYAAFAERDRDNVLKITVICGEDRLSGMLAHQGSYTHSEEQFEKDVNDFARRLAEELAGRLRSEELARKFAAG